MKNSNETYPTAAAIARVPAFSVMPSPRCFSWILSSPHRKCGELATRRRRGNRWFGDTFHCERHALETDVPVAGDFVIRRVRVTCDVLLSGTDETQSIAQGEAVDRLTAAIAAAGGILDIKLTTSQIGRYANYTPAPGTNAAPGSRE